MTIDKMTESECREVLGRTSIGRLGCSLDNQPYVLPIYFGFEADYAYVLSTLGQKIEWMRANPKVCLEIDEIRSESEWVSVIANGTYQELPEPQYAEERDHARKLLEKRYHWWINVMAQRRLNADDESITPLFFRIHVDSITGLRAGAKE
jgi:nitroimidazol reductase NimA-like FMN-containing flavoprotein (pyridoxamine 5'-phosphate oxidase superfamily)